MLSLLTVSFLSAEAEDTPSNLISQKSKDETTVWSHIVLDASFTMSARHNHIYNSTKGLNVGYGFVPHFVKTKTRAGTTDVPARVYMKFIRMS